MKSMNLCLPDLTLLLALSLLSTAPRTGRSADDASDASAKSDASAPATTAVPANGGASELFQLTRLHPMHLEMSVRDWNRMQQVVGRGPFGPRAANGQP